MPYKKRYYKKRRKPYYGANAKRGYIYGAAAGQLWKDVKKLKDAINVEYKFIDTTTNSNIDYNGTIVNLNSIPQGDSQSERDGMSVKCQTLTLKGYLEDGGTSTMQRVIVFWDKDNTITNVSDFLDSGMVGSNFACLANKQYTNRFKSKTLYDQCWTVDPASSGANRMFKKVIKVDRHTTFNGATLNDISSGRLKMLLISNQAPATSVPLFRIASRLSYTDN